MTDTNYYYDEDELKSLNEANIEYIYYNQYNSKFNLPPIDRIKEEGDWVYKIYCYGDYHKYLCRVFIDLDDPYNNFVLE